MSKPFSFHIRTLACLVVAIFSTGIASAECQVRTPLFSETVTVTWSYDAVSALYTYRYTVTNGSLSNDYIDTFWLGGADPKATLHAPSGWFALPLKKSVTFYPVAQYTGGNNTFSYGVPTDADIAPGSSLPGFELISKLSPGLVPYQMGLRRTLETVTEPLPRPLSEEESEALQEASIEECGALNGKQISRFGVTTGPSLDTVDTLKGASAKSEGDFKLLEFPSFLPLNEPITSAVLHNFEFGGHSVRIDSDGISVTLNSALRLKIPSAALAGFTCRTTAALLDLQSNDRTVLRAEVPGTLLGLDSHCSAGD